MNFKRFLLILICISISVGTFVSCADSNEDKKPSDYDQIYDGSSREKAKDTIPDGYSLDGKKIGIIYPEYYGDKPFTGDLESMDIVWSRVHERNLKVESRLNCKLEFTATGGPSWSNWDEYGKELGTKIMSIDDSFWLVFSLNNSVIQLNNFNLFHNMNNSEFVDIYEDWWYDDVILELSVDGSNYRFLYGDIHTGSMGNYGAILYNKDLYGQYLEPGNPDAPYQYVLDGTWTFERFALLCADSYVPLGGGNTLYAFNFAGGGTPILYFPVSAGIEFYERDAQGYPIVTLNNQKASDFCTDLYDLLFNNVGTQCLVFPTYDAPSDTPSFQNGNCIFSLSTINLLMSAGIREMNDEIGILPYPKYYKEDDYVTAVSDNNIFIACGKNIVQDIAWGEASAVIEALCSESYRSVILAYYETALQRAYTRDDMSMRMLDIIAGIDPDIKSTVKPNFLLEYTQQVGGIGRVYSEVMLNGGRGSGAPEWTSTLQGFGAYEKKIDDLYWDWVLEASK